MTETTDIGALEKTALEEIQNIVTPQDLENVRLKFLGKKGLVYGLTRQIGSLPPEERKSFGQSVNETRQKIEEALAAKKETLQGGEQDAKLAKEKIDVTLPGKRTQIGRHHPVSIVRERLQDIMIGLGFQFHDYPEVETDFNNFESLNTPKWHPARDEQDSFYTPEGLVLRTHTTAFQIHAMKNLAPPPIRAITSGKCYRRDKVDASHSAVFHQLDAISIDTNISFQHLKWTLYTFAQELFGKKTELRFRPSYFPFTTPSAEIDVSCLICGGTGCPACKQTGWVEILGSGMMRPEVLRFGGIDPDKYQGFAFGVGLERVAMLMYRINDIRLLYTNEMGFLEQF